MSSDVDICNLALLRIGQRQTITAIDGTDTTEPALACKIAYPMARDELLSRFVWPFASKRKTLYPAIPTDTDAIPGWAYAYALPADYLEAQYIFDGARPGRGAVPLVFDARLASVSAASMLPAINGEAPRAPFEVVGSYLFTDYAEPVPAWDTAITYAIGTIVSAGGTSWSAVIANAGNDPTTDDGTNWTASTTTQQAQLVYTYKVSDATKFPALFVQALAWRTASDLALSIAAKPQLAMAIEQQAEFAISRARAAALNAAEPDVQPDSSFIAVRG